MSPLPGEYIINCLTSKPLLIGFNSELPTKFHTNASHSVTELYFFKNMSQNRVVAYFSKRMSLIEARYHSHELETLAVVNCQLVEAFPYLSYRY